MVKEGAAPAFLARFLRREVFAFPARWPAKSISALLLDISPLHFGEFVQKLVRIVDARFGLGGARLRRSAEPFGLSRARSARSAPVRAAL